jgi:hypothetical protein
MNTNVLNNDPNLKGLEEGKHGSKRFSKLKVTVLEFEVCILLVSLECVGIVRNGPC